METSPPCSAASRSSFPGEQTLLHGSGSWAVDAACERAKWTISSQTGQILVGTEFYLHPSWGLVEAAVPV